MKLNTPTAILIGLTLIAGALFFRPPVISEAKAKAINPLIIKELMVELGRIADHLGHIALGVHEISDKLPKASR